jgi:hypothetical protein
LAANRQANSCTSLLVEMIDETWQMPHSYNLLGPHLLNNLLNLGLTQDCDEALKEFDLNLATWALVPTLLFSIIYKTPAAN